MTDLRSTQASPLLDLVRLAAAQAVCVGHAISFFGVLPGLQPPHAPYLQNCAVQVFFVLSGFVIAYSLASRLRDPAYGFPQYFIDRWARIYSAYIPALLVIAAIDFALLRAGRYEYPDYLTPQVFGANLLMLQNWGGAYRNWIVVPSFGSAGPLWSLAIEWWIYMLAGAIFFLPRARLIPLLALVIVVAGPAALAYLVGDVHPGIGTGLLSLWLLGFAGYFLAASKAFTRIPTGALALAALVAFGLYGSAVVPGAEYDMRAYAALGCGFIALVAAAMRFPATDWGHAGRIVRFGAGYSFTLYLVHHTVLYALSRFPFADPLAAALIGFVASNIVAALVAWPTEMCYRDLARWLKQKLRPRPAGALAG
jgi:peptidoglycan/LPS O-acetylase OafA/YrhL